MENVDVALIAVAFAQAVEAIMGNADLVDENDRLRELVRDMWCGAMQRMDYAERYAFASKFVDRMRELGIEVDDA